MCALISVAKTPYSYVTWAHTLLRATLFLRNQREYAGMRAFGKDSLRTVASATSSPKMTFCAADEIRMELIPLERRTYPLRNFMSCDRVSLGPKHSRQKKNNSK